MQRCPVSTWNPDTGKPFGIKLIRGVFTTECYDFDPESPWRYQARTQKVFIPEEDQQARLGMCLWFLAWPWFVAKWFFDNVVWFDPCASILAGSKKQWLKQRQVLKGNKGYVSDDARQYSRNGRGPPTALKQRGWEGRKMNWVMIRARGHVTIDILPEEWHLDGEGVATVVRRLEGRLREMLGAGARFPRVLMTDRGTGMYSPSGQVVAAYEAAVRECNFQLFWGPDAKQQAADMPDLLLHETAVSWFRGSRRKIQPVVAPWHETPAQWSRRAMQALDEVNLHCDAEGLCMSFPRPRRRVR